MGTISSLRSLGGGALEKFSRQRRSNWVLLSAGNAAILLVRFLSIGRSAAALSLGEIRSAHTVTLYSGGQSSPVRGTEVFIFWPGNNRWKTLDHYDLFSMSASAI